MVDILKILSDNFVKYSQHYSRDTLYFAIVNSESEFVKILPVIIACIALLFSAYSIFISRRALMANIKHQKLSIQPLLAILEDFSFTNS